MWMGELITQRGIGNGISLMIFASIVSRLPGAVQQWYDTNNQVFKVIAPFLVLAVVAGIVFVQEGQRRIPVQYAKRVIGRRMTSGQQTYLPLRVNMAGVIPVIFAASLMAFRRRSVSSSHELVAPLRGLLLAERLALHLRRGSADHCVHLLLHGGHVQSRRSGRQPQEVRRLSSPASGRDARPPSSSTGYLLA